MANYDNIKATINANIKTNGNQEISGSVLNSVLNQIVSTLGIGYQFAAVATTATDPGSPDAKVFYIANGKGTYTNFGGVEVTEDDVVILYWDTAWHKAATGIASQAKLSELESKVDDALYLETAIVSIGERTGYLNSPGSYIADADYEILSFPVPKGGKIHVFGKIDKPCRAIFSDQPAAIDTDAFLGNIWINSLNEETDIDVEVEVPEYTGQVYARVSKKKTLPMSVTLINPINRIDKLEQKVDDIEDDVTSIEYIYVAPNGNDETGDGTIANPYATIFHANEMITDNSEKHRYIIKVADGTYTDLQSKYAGVTASTLQGVVAKNFVSYEGNVLHPERVVLKWDGSVGYTEPYNYDTMFFTKCLFHIISECTTSIKGFTFDAKNTRYALHIETSGAGQGSKWEVSDCIFNWRGVPSRTNTPTIGTGSGFFEKGHLLRCKIINDIANIDGFRNHDSSYPSYYDINRFKEGAEIILESCDFGNSSILMRTMDADNKYDGVNRLIIKNCIGITSLSHSEFAGATINSWRARVECSNITTNNFADSEMY